MIVRGNLWAYVSIMVWAFFAGALVVLGRGRYLLVFFFCLFNGGLRGLVFSLPSSLSSTPCIILIRCKLMAWLGTSIVIEALSVGLGETAAVAFSACFFVPLQFVSFCSPLASLLTSLLYVVNTILSSSQFAAGAALPSCGCFPDWLVASPSSGAFARSVSSSLFVSALRSLRVRLGMLWPAGQC